MPRGARAATLADVAKASGVSISTASRTLNTGNARVAEGTQARIRAAAAQLGYATNRAAQAVVRGRSQTVGLIVDGYDRDYANPVAVGVYEAAQRRGLLVVEATTGGSLERAARAVGELRGHRSQALFVVGRKDVNDEGFAELLDELERFQVEGGRVVMIGQGDVGFDAVNVDDHAAGHDMALALWDLGYRDFFVFGDALSHSVSRARSDGFVEGLRSQGHELTPDRLILMGFSWEGGYRAAGELLTRSSGSSRAVFCTNDSTAIGAIRRLTEAGVVVGEEVAVAGCDDLAALRDLDPPLTTIHLPWDAVGEAAFALAAATTTESRVEVLAGHVVVRRSSPLRGPGTIAST